MALYCAICQYPAPCGRDHGEEPDGSPVHSVYSEPDAWVHEEGVLIDPNLVTVWNCVHCQIRWSLAEVREHIGVEHPDCLSCQAESLLCAGILEYQARHRDGSFIH